MTDSATKQTLRLEAVRHRDRIVPAAGQSDDAAALFLQKLKPQNGQVVSLYWPKGREFDTLPLIERLLAEGVICALPVVLPESRELAFYQWDGVAPLTEGAFKVMEPLRDKQVDPDIVVAPLLAFDRRGGRLGYGGGYYDATLRALRARKKVTAVGLAYAEQAVLFSLPRDEHDEKLDWVITPQGAHYFGE